MKTQRLWKLAETYFRKPSWRTYIRKFYSSLLSVSNKASKRRKERNICAWTKPKLKKRRSVRPIIESNSYASKQTKCSKNNQSNFIGTCNTRIEWLTKPKTNCQIWKSKRGSLRFLILLVIFIQFISINLKYDERNRIREILLLISMVSFKVVDQCRVTKYFENYSSLLSSSFHC